LRLLGSELDARGAQFISIIETPTGISMRYLPPDGGDAVAEHYTYREIAEATPRKETFLGRKRRPNGAASYEDFLRALGHELNEALAASILIDEIENGFVVTYQAHDMKESGLLPRKKIVIMGPEELQLLMDEAYARRRPSVLRRWGIL
jgi:hypothetical protein